MMGQMFSSTSSSFRESSPPWQTLLALLALCHLTLAQAGSEPLDERSSVLLHDSRLDAASQWNAVRADVDGDGVQDLILGLPGHDHDRGRVVVIYGPEQAWPDRIDLANLPGELAHEFHGEMPGDRLGHAVLPITRGNDPEQTALLIGAPGARNPDGLFGSGTVYVINQADRLTELSLDMLDGQSGYRLLAGSNQDHLGSDLVALGGPSDLPVALSASPWTSLLQDSEPPYQPAYWPGEANPGPTQLIGQLRGLRANPHRQYLADRREFFRLPSDESPEAMIMRANAQGSSDGLALEFQLAGLIGTGPEINGGAGIPDQFVLAGELMTLDFAISDSVDPPGELSVNVSFLTTPFLIDPGSVALSGTGTIRTLVAQTVTGFPDGSESLEITVTNTQGVDAVAPFQVFVFNNSVPEINGGLGLMDEFANPGDLLEIPFTATDLLFDSDLLTYSATSSDQALLPDSALTLDGNGANRLLSIQTAPVQVGQTTISVEVGNPNGQSVTEQFLLTIEATGPVINDGNGIPDATVIAGDVLMLDFTVSDPDFLPSDITTSALSGNPALVPDTALNITGTAGVRTLAIIAPAGVSGQALIEVAATNPDAATATESFLLTVIPPAVAPAINGGAGIANQSVLAGEILNVAFQVSDPVDPPQNLALTAQSNTPSVISNASLSLLGTDQNRVLRIQTSPGQSGQAGITVAVTNLAGLTTTAAFTVAIIPRTPPSINFGQGIPDRTASAGELIEINLSVSDLLDPPGNLLLIAESLTPEIVPDAALQLLGTGTSRILRIDTEPGRTGIADIRLTLTNTSGLSTQDSFSLELTVDEVPVINDGEPLPDRTIPPDEITRIEFAVRDSEGQPGDIELRVTSTDQNVLPNEALRLESEGPDWVLEIDTSLGRPGTTLIIVEARHPDGGISQTSFELTIDPASTELAIQGESLNQQIGDQRLARLVIENTGDHTAFDLQVTLEALNGLEVTGTWSQASGCWVNDGEVGCDDLAGAAWQCRNDNDIPTCRLEQLAAAASAVLIVAVRTSSEGQLQVDADASNAESVAASFNPGN